MSAPSPARGSARSFAVAIGFGLLALIAWVLDRLAATGAAVDYQHDHNDSVGWRYIAYALTALAVVFLVKSLVVLGRARRAIDRRDRSESS
jgi:hypothetical protein